MIPIVHNKVNKRLLALKSWIQTPQPNMNNSDFCFIKNFKFSQLFRFRAPGWEQWGHVIKANCGYPLRAKSGGWVCHGPISA